jgi:hypothetical protein
MIFREVIQSDGKTLFSEGSIEQQIKNRFPSAVITPNFNDGTFNIEIDVTDDLEFYMFMVDINALQKCINLRKDHDAGTNKELVKRLVAYKHRVVYVKSHEPIVPPVMPEKIKVELKVENKDAAKKERRRLKRAERKRKRLEKGQK